MQYLCNILQWARPLLSDHKSEILCFFVLFSPTLLGHKQVHVLVRLSGILEFDQHYFVPVSLFSSVIETTHAQSVTHCVEKSWLPSFSTSSKTKSKINWPTGLSFHFGAHCFPNLHTMTCATSVYKSNVHCCRRNSACLFTFTVLMTLCICLVVLVIDMDTAGRNRRNVPVGLLVLVTLASLSPWCARPPKVLNSCGP